jgi:hypothetical protein
LTSPPVSRAGLIDAGDAAASADAEPATPSFKPPDGLENRRVTALAIMRSGGASSGDEELAAGSAGAGARDGEKPKDERREDQRGPVADIIRLGDSPKISQPATIAPKIQASIRMRFSSSIPEG